MDRPSWAICGDQDASGQETYYNTLNVKKLLTRGVDALKSGCCNASFAVQRWESQLREIVDQALGTYELTSRMDPMQLAQSRDRITQYLDKLMSAGQADPNQLTEYARAYLKEMHEGRDPRFTGC
jgi:hypothetical protein